MGAFVLLAVVVDVATVDIVVGILVDVVVAVVEDVVLVEDAVQNVFTSFVGFSDGCRD